MKVETEPPRDLVAILEDDDAIDGAMRKAARQAIEEHRREGLPLAMWRDGKVVWVPAEELAEELEAEIGASE